MRPVSNMDGVVAEVIWTTPFSLNKRNISTPNGMRKPLGTPPQDRQGEGRRR